MLTKCKGKGEVGKDTTRRKKKCKQWGTINKSVREEE